MRSKNIVILILGIILLGGCEEQFDWAFSNKDANLLSVEAIITNENKNHLIKLTKSYNQQNVIPEPAAGALVAILTATDTIIAIENPPGSGLYYTDSMQAVVDKLYVLGIQYNGNLYHAYEFQEPGDPFEKPLEYRQVAEELYTINFSESEGNPNYIKYYLDWQGVGNCQNNIDCQAKQIYYDLKNIDVNKQFKPDQERVDFPAGTVIIRQKYTVSNRYREYLRGMLSETYWRGGMFDAFPANAATNLEGGAVGYFAVTTVVTDTTLIVQ